MRTSKPNARRARHAETTYEIFVEVDGRELYNRDLFEFAPNMKHIVPDEIVPALTLVGETRRNILVARSQILKRHPTAEVTIFEYPTRMAEELDAADAGEFKPSSDGLTCVPRRAAKR